MSNSGIIGPRQTTTGGGDGVATGRFTLSNQQQLRGASLWPTLAGENLYTTAGTYIVLI